MTKTPLCSALIEFVAECRRHGIDPPELRLSSSGDYHKLRKAVREESAGEPLWDNASPEAHLFGMRVTWPVQSQRERSMTDSQQHADAIKDAAQAYYDAVAAAERDGLAVDVYLEKHRAISDPGPRYRVEVELTEQLRRWRAVSRPDGWPAAESCSNEHESNYTGGG